MKIANFIVNSLYPYYVWSYYYSFTTIEKDP